MATAATEKLWTERIHAWRESGQTSDVFAQGKGFAASTLRLYASRLQVRPRVTPVMPRLVELVRRPAAMVAAGSPSQLLVEVGVVRVRVARGFDAVLLREVVTALGSGGAQ